MARYTAGSPLDSVTVTADGGATLSEEGRSDKPGCARAIPLECLGTRG